MEMNTARSDTLPNVALKELSLLHIVPEAARYEMVTVPQKVASVDGGAVCIDPLIVPLARCPSMPNSPLIVAE